MSSHIPSDLVSRLRNGAAYLRGIHKQALWNVHSNADDCEAAANCIEQLQMPHAEVLRLADRQDGADALALINALCRKVEAQKREIERLHAKADRLINLAMERGARS